MVGVSKIKIKLEKLVYSFMERLRIIYGSMEIFEFILKFILNIFI